MKISNTSNRLKEVMSLKNIKQIDVLKMSKPFCDKFKIKLGKSDLSQFVSGKVEPGQWKLTILGMALNVSETWLMGYDVPMERNDIDNKNEIDIFSIYNLHPVELRQIPLLGEIACGVPIFANEDRKHYIMADCDIKADFCLTAKGDSMINADIHDGDIVFIQNQPIVDDGEIAVVIIGDEATLKRVYINEDGLTLVAENPKFRPMTFSKSELDEIHILGRATSIQRTIK